MVTVKGANRENQRAIIVTPACKPCTETRQTTGPHIGANQSFSLPHSWLQTLKTLIEGPQGLPMVSHGLPLVRENRIIIRLLKSLGPVRYRSAVFQYGSQCITTWNPCQPPVVSFRLFTHWNPFYSFILFLSTPTVLTQSREFSTWLSG